MRKLLVVQHVPHEILGTLNPLLKRSGFRIRYVNFGRHPEAEPTLERYHALVVLGGPMSVNDAERCGHLTTEMKLIEQAMKLNLPVLGICLGAQLIAKTLGAGVYRAEEKEIGWYDVTPTKEAEDDPLLAKFGATEKIFQWHGDTFDIPKSAVHLASSPLCSSQAFRYGGSVYGLQFHLEVDEAMINRWLRVSENRKEIESLVGKVNPDRIQMQTHEYIQRLRELSDRVFSELVKIFGVQRKFLRLPSH